MHTMYKQDINPPSPYAGPCAKRSLEPTAPCLVARTGECKRPRQLHELRLDPNTSGTIPKTTGREHLPRLFEFVSVIALPPGERERSVLPPHHIVTAYFCDFAAVELGQGQRSS